MKITLVLAFLLTTLVVLFLSTPASASSFSRPTDLHRVDLKLSDLRSAYLIRTGVVRYDAHDNSPEKIRAQLQRHFDVVIGLLLLSTPRSIETAIARLESVDDHTWAAQERGAWRRKLLTNRYAQLQRLVVYRDRGLFPLNEGQTSQPMPIFVDEHNTACAVGQLMRWSGWQQAVAEIQHSNNLVYVPDAHHSSVSSWTMTSGLTLEEAALIQPAYGGLYTSSLMHDYEPGELSLIQNGLKYENFRFEAQNYAFVFPGFSFHQALDLCDGCLFTSSPGGTLPDINNIGIEAGAGLLFVDNGFFGLIGTNWLVIGGKTRRPPNGFSSPQYINGMSQQFTVQRIRVTFDVSTTAAGSYISLLAEHAYPGYGGFAPLNLGGPNYAGEYEFTTTALNAGTQAGSVHAENVPGQFFFDPAIASANLMSPASSLTVATTMWIYNGATINSYVLGFSMVPEPTGAFLVFAGLVPAFLSTQRRRQADWLPRRQYKSGS